MARLIGPDFIALQVHDLERSTRFYVEQLGLTPARRSPPGAVVFDTAPIPFALREPLVDLAATDRLGWGVSLWVACDDADALHAALTEAGVPIVTPPANGPFGRFFSLRDPDGYTVTAHTAAVVPPAKPRATLDPGAGHAILINTFSVEPDRADELLAALSRATEEVFRGLPGFVSANLHLSRNRRCVVNYAQWRSHADYEAMFRDPEVQAHMREAAALALSFDPVFYDLRQTHAAGGAL